MSKTRKIFLISIFLIGIISGFFSISFYIFNRNQVNIPEDDNEVINPSIILLIGDGMGLSHIKLGNLVEYGSDNNSSILNFPYQTNVSTLNYYGDVTDSAAAATAISTGHKTANQRVAYSIDGRELKTILEYAEEKKYNTGLIVSSDLRHATPASFAAHNISRNNNNDLSKDMANSGAEILFGGGLSQTLFGNQIDYMKDSLNYTFIQNKSDLFKTSSLKTLGLFADNGLMREMDRTINTSQPSLYDLAIKAIKLLENNTKPYFLMIEGSQIDWASHQNNKYYLAQEMIAFEKITRFVNDLADSNPNLQILVTADHETGGLSLENYNFEIEKPLDEDSLQIKIEKRYNRTREINVSWDTTGHTSRKVILSGKGNRLNNLNKSTHLIDIFDLMFDIIQDSNLSTSYLSHWKENLLKKKSHFPIDYNHHI